MGRGAEHGSSGYCGTVHALELQLEVGLGDHGVTRLRVVCCAVRARCALAFMMRTPELPPTTGLTLQPRRSCKTSIYAPRCAGHKHTRKNRYRSSTRTTLMYQDTRACERSIDCTRFFIACSRQLFLHMLVNYTLLYCILRRMYELRVCRHRRQYF